MKREAAYAAKLIDQVVEKSSGVFLWVRIVVASLIAGLSNHDKVVDLERRVGSLPPELDDLYGKILDDIDPFYSAPASQYFQLLLANDGSAEGLLLSFADEDKDFCLTLPSAIMSRDEHSARLLTLGRRLSSSCKGLLELGPNGRVSLLHRTLRDFLVRPENQEKIGNATRESGFDAHLKLCSGFYCLTKAVEFGSWTASRNDAKAIAHLTDAFTPTNSNRISYNATELVVTWFTECLKRASLVTVGNHEMVNVLDSLDKDLKDLPRLRQELSGVARATRTLFFAVEEGPITYDDLLPFATRFGVAHYVRAKAKPQATHHLNVPYISTRARLLNSVFGRPIPPHRNQRQRYHTSLLVNACLIDPPSPEMFQSLVSCHGAGSELRSALYRPNIPLYTRATSGSDIVHLYGLSMLEIIVGTALISSVARKTASAASQAWSQWVPVLRLFAGSYSQRLDIRSAKAVTERYEHLPLTGPRPMWTKTALTPEDLVKVLEIDCPDSNCIGNWRTILGKINPSRTTVTTP